MMTTLLSRQASKYVAGRQDVPATESNEITFVNEQTGTYVASLHSARRGKLKKRSKRGRRMRLRIDRHLGMQRDN